MDWISTELERLANVVEVNILYSANGGFITWGVEHNGRSILISCGRFVVSLVNDIPCQQTDFSPHFNFVFTIGAIRIDIGIVLIFKSLV